MNSENMTKKTPTDARQGETGGHMPIVLGVSLASVVIAFAAVMVFIVEFPTHH